MQGQAINIIRTPLPTPDAVIVREPCGRLHVVADTRLSDEYVQGVVLEAPHVRDGRPFGRSVV